MCNYNYKKETIFITRYEVHGEVFSLIIDSGSYSNMVSKEVLGKLGLVTRKLEESYMICWLNGIKDIKFNYRTLLDIAIGP